MRINDEEFLRYYTEELRYLRLLGQSFAHTYPKIAARLELHNDESSDPHVERLIESFAFLTARIRRTLDEDFPEVATQLLDVLYPHFLRPIPSMAIARCDLDPQRTTGIHLKRHTRLFANTGDGDVCRWRTSSAATLWPVEVTEAVLLAPGVTQVLRLRLESRGEPFEKLEIDRLRFHLAGDSVIAARLYEILMNEKVRVVAVPARDVEHPLPPGSVRGAGFDEDEAILPYPPQSQPGYRLLQEYFAFPDKFHFFEVANLGEACARAQKKLDLLFLLPQTYPRLDVSPANFLLNCVPVVNLFEKTTEPIRVDHRRLEYRLVADARRETTTEVHSILSVSGTANPQDKTRQYEPFYAWSHDLGRRVQRTFWHARRVLSLYDRIVGTEMLLSFLDLDFNPRQPSDEVVWAHTLCTNRVLADQMPSGALLQTDEAAVAKIHCLKKPTHPVAPPLGGEAVWRLVSHLSLNYLSISDNDTSRRALQDILRLYAPRGTGAIEQQIGAIREVTNRQVMRRVGKDPRRAFCRGTEISLTLDEGMFVGSSAFLFAAVLNRFFALWTPTSSFAQLVLRRPQQEDFRWQPMAAGKPLP